MDEDPAHAERIGHPAGVLPARAAKARQGVGRDVMASLDGDLLDGVRHVLHGDPQESLRQLLGRPAYPRRPRHLLRQRGELTLDRRYVDRCIALRSEYAWEVLGLQAAQHDIAVRDRQRSSAPIAGRPGNRPRGLRADPQPDAVETADGAATCRHGVDMHHWRADANTRDQSLEGALELTGIVGYVGRGAPHVEADDSLRPRLGGGAHHADDSACRAGKDRVLAVKAAGLDETTVR